MVVKVTEGIEVQVRTNFDLRHSKPNSDFFWFNYRIRIENKSSDAVQLLRRHWLIYDSFLLTNEVEGEGVVGETPYIEPGDSHSYDSHCNLHTDMGFMEGTYLMKRISDGHLFFVDIPKFGMVAPFRLN
ncbi:MAG TPA: Co2+/Mg2+ efflux protein ApaG [Flavobacteriales bacterium]|nr:Co2+/Mg2+ efflux protein ApaG [Salibacteraceae bacterium]HAS36057.1 Co2+/Mg2+ efflux protein ApaG [Flavobacteriales bacterium]